MREVWMNNMLDFTAEIQEILKVIERKGVGVLATSAEGIPTTRMVSVVVIDGKIVFQTSTALEKYQQIAQNRHVAMDFTNINMQGVAFIRDGQALEHEDFVAKFKEKHESSYNAYTKM